MAHMQKMLTLMGATLALGVGLSLPASADDMNGFAIDSANSLVKDGSGNCLRTPRWSDGMACGGSVATRSLPVGPADSDGDGVVDSRDRCPGTTPGAKVNMIGCEIIVKVKAPVDADKDGVADENDRCPGTPAGVTVDEFGCQLDEDFDGVVDASDTCPGTPAGVRVDEKGCEIIEKIILRDINFARDSDSIGGAIQPLYDAAHKLRKHDSRIKSLVITGHTDSTGSAAYNQRLSRQRAQSVANYMIEQGVSASKITVRGLGERSPIADNRTSAGRAANRRVEIDVDMASN